MPNEGARRSLARPRTSALPGPLRGAAIGIAERLRDAGRRGWICGGAVRDLALGRAPREIDMASAATPEEIEALFPWTLPVGKAFGTVLVRSRPDPGGEPLAIELTTFRSEAGYSDARRPDAVAFGATPEEDARRRDFTCNALFLDPLDDTLLDPEGGLEDLAHGRLACVGDPARRFAEDGLRLLRLARFAAAFELEPSAETRNAARASTAALAGVSPERVLDELGKLLSRPGAARGLALFAEIGIAEPLLGAWIDPDAFEGRVGALARLDEPAGLERGLALLLAEPEVAEAALASLRASRALTRAVTGRAGLARELERLAARGEAATRAERIRALRDEAFADALAIAIARGDEHARAGLERLGAERRALSDAALRPEPWIRSDDLARTGLARGPAWAELLREAETAQLDGAFADRDAALAWLARRVRDHDGGKTPRST